MNTSASIGALAEALAKARKDFRPVLKKSKNPFFKSNYADLAEVIEATSTALADNGLSIIQTPGHVALVDGASQITLTSRLVHSSGEWIESEMSLPLSKCDAQGAGSATTYARRYAYQSIVGVAAEADDDGNEASGTAKVSGGTVYVDKKPVKSGSVQSQPKSADSAPVTQNRMPEKKSTAFNFGANQDSANQPNAGEPAATAATPLAPEPKQASSPASASKNIHGVAIVDTDLPDNMRPATKEELAVIGPQIKAIIGQGNMSKLGTHIKSRFKTERTTDITKANWDEVLADLKAGKQGAMLV